MYLRTPCTLHDSVGLDRTLKETAVSRAFRVAWAVLDDGVDHLHARAAGCVQQPCGLGQHVVLLDHRSEAEVLERPVFVDYIVFKVHYQERRVPLVYSESHA